MQQTYLNISDFKLNIAVLMIEKTHVVSKDLLNSIFFLLGKSSKTVYKN